MRNFQKIKTIDDYRILDSPELVDIPIDTPIPGRDRVMILRMLVRAKYGDWRIPIELGFLSNIIRAMYAVDVNRTGIKDSWCYVTIRHGLVESQKDDEWHFDGASFRTDIIPERNYVWVNHSPTEYKAGKLKIPADFNPVEYNLFTFASHQLKNARIRVTEPEKWHLLSPFCLHRRPKKIENRSRTFYRICFTDIEGRDINNTQNPALPTPFYGRDPVKSFRDSLKNYY